MFKKLIIVALLSLMFAKSGSDFDPDIDFCNDPTLSGGIVADDGWTYLFKGNYYWRTQPINPGIVKIDGFGELVSSKWPEITDSITFVFTIPINNSLFNVFVVKNQWFGYQKGVKVMEGTVNSWPDINNLVVTSTFTWESSGDRSTQVYVLHSNNQEYILYDLKNMSNPKKEKSGPTTIRGYTLFFTELPIIGDTIDTLIDLRAGLTYKEKLFLLSKDKFCEIDLLVASHSRECIPQDVNQILGCPFDISNRPTTTTKLTTTQSTTMRTTTTISEITTNTKTPEMESSSSEQSIPSNSTVKPEESEPAVDPTVPEEEDKNEGSHIWFIVFIVALIGITICTLIVITMISMIKNKNKFKGEVVYIN